MTHSNETAAVETATSSERTRVSAPPDREKGWPSRRWLLLLLVGLMVITAGLMWPQLLAPVVYGCQPGLLVLLVVLSLHWLVQERYRRQVVFMPGFTRMQSNSSLLRAGQGNRPREPSTVDSPAAPPAGGSGS